MADSDEGRRPKRQKRDTSYKAKAFEKFKQLKEGTRSKYEVEDVDNVYDMVEEKEYVKRVLDRQDGWIVDDDGSGYVEDGREIFDDDMDQASIAQALSQKKGVKRKKKMVSDIATKNNLQYMLSNMPQKKKEDVKIDGDEDLLEILNEIDEAPSCSSKPSVKSFVPRKQITQNYMKTFSLPNLSKVRKLNDHDKQSASNRNENEMDIDVNLPSCSKHNQIDNNLKSSESEVPIDICKDKEVAIVADNNSETTDFLPDGFEESLDLLEMERIESEALKQTAKTTTDASSNEIVNSLPFVDDNFSASQSQISYTDPLPVDMDDKDEKNTFKFYWFDVFEDPSKQKGTIFLFGKMYDRQKKVYVSCCAAVKDIDRQIFVLPRPYMLDDDGRETDKTVTLKEVYTEFKKRITEPMAIKSFRHAFVPKKYAFDATVPHESDYMEVRYPSTEPEIDLQLLQVPPKSFSRIFGINTTNIERFLLDRKIKGPCWLELTNSQMNNNPLSWCTEEIICPSMKYVRKIDCETVPPLVVTTLNFRYHVNRETNANELLMISCVTQTAYQFDKQQPTPPFDQHFCVFTSPEKQSLPIDLYQYLSNYKGTRVQKMDSEKALLHYFINQFSKTNCDIVVGHDLQGFQIKVLVDRLIKHKVMITHKLSRLRRSQKIKHLDRLLFTGRLVCDIKISAKEFIRSRMYDLSALCQLVLKLPPEQRVDLEQDEISKMYEQSGDIIKLITYTMQDAAYILKIFYDLNIIPLYMQITKIAGNILSRTLLGGRSERNEFLLLHAFTENGYIVPDKKYYKNDNQGGGEGGTKTKKTPAYSGGLVLDPKIGFYDKYVLLMDFNSLYPSIIQEYNICYTTLQVGNDTDTNITLPDASVEPGILPVQIRRLVESRKQVKQLMKTPDLAPDVRRKYDIRQLALKLTANSMYGCLGFSNSRFYAKNLAALITQKGREILTNTKDLVEKMGFEVIYGDTDSIMINTNKIEYDPVIKLGIKIKQEINKLYKQIELDIDGVFKYLLLLKKKKYAAVLLSKLQNGELKEQKEYKGLDVVRRDWSEIASETGKFILDYILSDQSPDDRVNNICNYLVKIKEELMENKIPIQLLTISKQLVKEPHMYANKDVMSHVQVAMRYNKEHGGHYHAGDIINYVICIDGTDRSATQRAYHTEELKIMPNLKIDVNYYLSQQIFPIVLRICEPIDGIDSYQIAQCLGVQNYSKPTLSQTNSTVGTNITTPAIKFQNVVKFKFTCSSCKAENVINGPLNGNVPFLERCTNTECKTRPLDYLYSILNQLTLTMRSYIKKYYTGKLICEDPSCLNEVKRIPLKFVGKFPVCTVCQEAVMYRAYTEKDLFLQLSYFVYIFDLNQLPKKPLMEESINIGYQKLHKLAEDQLKQSKYAVIDLGSLFAAAQSKNGTDSKPERKSESSVNSVFRN